MACPTSHRANFLGFEKSSIISLKRLVLGWAGQPSRKKNSGGPRYVKTLSFQGTNLSSISYETSSHSNSGSVCDVSCGIYTRQRGACWCARAAAAWAMAVSSEKPAFPAGSTPPGIMAKGLFWRWRWLRTLPEYAEGAAAVRYLSFSLSLSLSLCTLVNNFAEVYVHTTQPAFVFGTACLCRVLCALCATVVGSRSLRGRQISPCPRRHGFLGIASHRT